MLARALIEILRDAHELRYCRRIAAQGDRIAGREGDDRDRRHRTFARHALRRQCLQRLGDLAGVGVLQIDHAGRAIIAIDLADQLTHPADIVGIVRNDDTVGAAIGGDRTLAADQRTQALDRLSRVDRAEAEHFGHEFAGGTRAAADAAGLRGGAFSLLDTIGPAAGRYRDETVGAQGR